MVRVDITGKKWKREKDWVRRNLNVPIKQVSIHYWDGQEDPMKEARYEWLNQWGMDNILDLPYEEQEKLCEEALERGQMRLFIEFEDRDAAMIYKLTRLGVI